MTRSLKILSSYADAGEIDRIENKISTMSYTNRHELKIRKRCLLVVRKVMFCDFVQAVLILKQRF